MCLPVEVPLVGRIEEGLLRFSGDVYYSIRFQVLSVKIFSGDVYYSIQFQALNV